jgi:hypothetical protein
MFIQFLKYLQWQTAVDFRFPEMQRKILWRCNIWSTTMNLPHFCKYNMVPPESWFVLCLLHTNESQFDLIKWLMGLKSAELYWFFVTSTTLKKSMAMKCSLHQM